jgi:hypothetical protein
MLTHNTFTYYSTVEQIVNFRRKIIKKNVAYGAVKWVRKNRVTGPRPSPLKNRIHFWETNLSRSVAFKVLKAVVMNVVIFRDTAPRSPYVKRRFGRTYHLHLKG